MPTTFRDNSGGAEIVVLPMARVPPQYEGLDEARLRAHLRRQVMDLTQHDLVELARWFHDLERGQRPLQAASSTPLQLHRLSSVTDTEEGR